jgi:hypothetical protein
MNVHIVDTFTFIFFRMRQYRYHSFILLLEIASKLIITGSTANLKKVLKANMEESSQKMKVVNGQPALKTKGTNSVKEQLGAKTSKKKRTKKPSTYEFECCYNT